jgi:hypothetical protein
MQFFKVYSVFVLFLVIPSCGYMGSLNPLGSSHPYSSAHSSIERLRENQLNEVLKKYKNVDEIPKLELESSAHQMEKEANKILQNCKPLPFIVDASASDIFSDVEIEKPTFRISPFSGWHFVMNIKFRSNKSFKWDTGIKARFLDIKQAVIDESTVYLSSSGFISRPGELTNATTELEFKHAPKVTKVVFELAKPSR